MSLWLGNDRRVAGPGPPSPAFMLHLIPFSSLRSHLDRCESHSPCSSRSSPKSYLCLFALCWFSHFLQSSQRSLMLPSIKGLFLFHPASVSQVCVCLPSSRISRLRNNRESRKTYRCVHAGLDDRCVHVTGPHKALVIINVNHQHRQIRSEQKIWNGRNELDHFSGLYPYVNVHMTCYKISVFFKKYIQAWYGAYTGSQALLWTSHLLIGAILCRDSMTCRVSPPPE